MTLDLTLDDVRQTEALETWDSWELGALRAEKANERTIRTQGYGATKGAQAVIERYIAECASLVTTHAEASKIGRQQDGVKDLVEILEQLDPEVIALAGLQSGLHSVACEHTLSETYFEVGKVIEDEVWAAGLRSRSTKEAKRTQTSAKRRAGMAQRRIAARAHASRNGYDVAAWNGVQRAKVGKWVVDVLLMSPVFALLEKGEDNPEDRLSITEEALTISDEMMKHLLEARPVPLPVLEQPKPWVGLKTTFESKGRPYSIPLLRRVTYKGANAALQKAHREGNLDRLYNALNIVQNVPWAINEPIMEMIAWAYENNVEVSSLPNRQDLDVRQVLKNAGMAPDLSDEEFQALPEEAKALRKRLRGQVKQRNRSLIGEREGLKRDLSIAQILVEKGNRFYTPTNMDWRGRVYPVSYFGFIRQDHIRALFRFTNAKPLTERGLYWLKVHLANCASAKTEAGKTDKLPFDDRARWVEENLGRLMAMAESPKDDLWWTEMDQPFLFLAASLELYHAYSQANPHEYVCGIPLSWDGSCSGLQHLAAMTRCQDTAALVNVSPQEKPQDVYKAIADAVREVVSGVAEDESSEFREVARLALDYGIDRSLVKRNVMTFSYASPKAGMVDQQKADTMRPLQDKVILGKLSKHPFEVPEDTITLEDGTTLVRPGNKAAQFLGSTVYDTIQKVVIKPAKAMKYLQDIAGALAHEAKPVTWYTPLGLPVTLMVPKTDTDRIQLFMSDNGVRKNKWVNVQVEKEGIDKRRAKSAIASCFVHSMDACHLQMVCLRAAEEGITDMALVHDSFGCLPCDVDRYREIIKGEFHKLYATHDVLAEIKAAASEQLESNHKALPEDFEMGSLDINEVLEAEYAFA